MYMRYEEENGMGLNGLYRDWGEFEVEKGERMKRVIVRVWKGEDEGGRGWEEVGVCGGVKG